jgi:hypothetical protein
VQHILEQKRGVLNFIISIIILRTKNNLSKLSLQVFILFFIIFFICIFVCFISFDFPFYYVIFLRFICYRKSQIKYASYNIQKTCRMWPLDTDPSIQPIEMSRPSPVEVRRCTLGEGYQVMIWKVWSWSIVDATFRKWHTRHATFRKWHTRHATFRKWHTRHATFRKWHTRHDTLRPNQTLCSEYSC